MAARRKEVTAPPAGKGVGQTVCGALGGVVSAGSSAYRIGAMEPAEISRSVPAGSARLGRLRFRAWHRGTREADYIIGCFFDRFHASWSEAETAWFESLLEEDDVDIMAWALQTAPVPDRFAGPQMELMRKLDYVDIPR